MFSRPTAALSAAVILILLITSCRKQDQPRAPFIPVEYNEKVNASFSGTVLRIDGYPVEGAKVYAGNTFTTTDAAGKFTLQNVSVIKKSAFIKVEKEGYFQGSRTVIASENSDNIIKITMIKKQIIGTFNSSSAATTSLQGGNGEISFQANSIVTASGNSPYTGTVYVSAYYLDPSNPDFFTLMPGCLRGIAADNSTKMLKSYGMLVVEMTGSNNEKLQLAQGKPATIKIAVTPDAPQNIPLWHFNDSTGLWKEEGSAVKSGGYYVGTVTHFSFWNLDYPLLQTAVDITVLNPAGQPLELVDVIITDLTLGAAESGITNSLGKVHGYVYANRSLLIKVSDGCGTIYSGNIGPFPPSGGVISTQFITVTGQPSSTTSSSTISGTVTNANGTPGNGYIFLRYATPHQLPVTNGAFSGTIQYCGSLSNLSVAAIDPLFGTYGYGTGISTTGPNNIILNQQIIIPTFFSYNITGVGADSIIGCSTTYVNGMATSTAVSNQSSVTVKYRTTPQISGTTFYLLADPVIDSVIVRRGSDVYSMTFINPSMPTGCRYLSMPFNGLTYQGLQDPDLNSPPLNAWVRNQWGQMFLMNFRFATITN